MKLYTKSDLERAARLSLLGHVQAPEGDPELAIRNAVETVTHETPDYLTREQALEAAHLAIELALQDRLGKQDNSAVAERAVRAVLDERGGGR